MTFNYKSDDRYLVLAQLASWLWPKVTVCLPVCPFQSSLGGVLEVSRESLTVLKFKGVLNGVIE